MNFSIYKCIYFIGIGGIGMSALARYFHLKGKMVFGYDAVKSDLCVELEEEGMSIYYEENSIPKKIKEYNSPKILVIYTPAINKENKQLVYFLNKKIPLFKRAEILGLISENYYTVAIAGTHGKTTTSSILAHILRNSGRKCTAFLGGISKNYDTNLILGNENEVLIVEADEYDHSFLNFYPNISLITSLDEDHLDIYKDYQRLYLAFFQFTKQIKKEGILLIESNVKGDFHLPKKGVCLKYSAIHEADYFAEDVNIHKRISRFKIKIRNLSSEEQYEREIELCMPGIHNISNAIAAASISLQLGLSLDDIAKGIKSFIGIKRRYEIQISRDDLVFVDDYAHHPEEIKATIIATKQFFPDRKITVVFQPHLFSRTKNFAKEFSEALSLASEVIILEIYGARETPISGVDSSLLLKKCNAPKKETCSKKELLKLLDTKDIDVLLTLGAGDISTLVEPIKHMLN